MSADEVMHDSAGDDSTPSVMVADAELMHRIRERFSDEEWPLLQERAAGRAWNDIAQQMGTPPDRLRKRLDRAN